MNFVQILYKNTKQTSIVELTKETISFVDYFVLREQLSDYIIIACYLDNKKVVLTELTAIETLINNSDFYDMDTINDIDYNSNSSKRYFKISSNLLFPIHNNLIIDDLNTYPVTQKFYEVRQISLRDNTTGLVTDTYSDVSLLLGSKFVTKLIGCVEFSVIGVITDLYSTNFSYMKDWRFCVYDNGGNILIMQLLDSVLEPSKFDKDSFNFEYTFPRNFQILDDKRLKFKILLPDYYFNDPIYTTANGGTTTWTFKTHVSAFYINC